MLHPSCRVLAGAAFLFASSAVTARAEPAPSTPAGGGATAHTETRFKADPVTDTAVLGISLGFGALSELVISTGELAPQKPGSTSSLLSFDRVAVTQSVDPHASTLSGIGVGAAGAYALGDTIYTGFVDGREAGLVDTILYAESAGITFATANLVKIAVRRPRPRTYRLRDELAAKGQPYPSNPGTDSSLSFFSGHTAETAALSATAAYLAFARSHSSTRGWITLVAGTALTGFVGYERVRAAAHFPTDVIAGAIVGGGIGTLVPALHRASTPGQPPLWVGVIHPGRDGTGLALAGLF